MKRTFAEIINLQENLAKEYKYKPIPPLLSMQYRQDYLDSLPAGMLVQGNKNCRIYSKEGTLIACGYSRIVVGDYGAFIEFSPKQAVHKNIVIKRGQEYRVNDERYAKNIKYHWLTAADKSDCKIYYQIKTVEYADYKPKMYYVSPYDVKIRYERSFL